MYPDLSYLFRDLIGTSPDNWLSIFKTFGLLLATALLAAGFVVKKDLQRREEEGSIKPIQRIVEVKGGLDWSAIVTNALIGLVLAMKIPYVIQHFAEFQADPASVIFSGKGNLLFGLVGAAILGGYFYYLESKADRKPGKIQETILPSSKSADITILAGISGVAGAKVFSVLENLDSFFADPLGTLFSGSGLTVYGGILFGTFFVYRYIKKLGIPPRQMLDIGGMAILVGYGVGRMGCHFSGDGDWGIVAAAQPSWWFLPDWLWSYSYPNNVANSGTLMDSCDPALYREYMSAQMSVEQRCQAACGIRYCHEMSDAKVYPTSIYEIVMAFGMFAFLWMWRKKVKIAGMLFCMYLIIQGIERWLIETIRVNDRYEYFGFNWSQAQWISVLLVILGIAGIFYLRKRYGSPKANN